MSSVPLYIITLTIAFVALDVTGKVEWAWWQVTMPVLAAVGLGAVGIFVRAMSNDSKSKR